MLKKIKKKICEIICKYLKLHHACVIMNATVKRRINNEKKVKVKNHFLICLEMVKLLKKIF
jgi:hypothetical protein